jgi:hypothetical protein
MGAAMLGIRWFIGRRNELMAAKQDDTVLPPIRTRSGDDDADEKETEA